MESEDAVTFQLPIVDEGVSLHIDTEPFREALRSFFKGYEKRILAFRTALYRCIFPASPVSLGVIVVLIVGLWLEGYDVSWGLLPPLLALSRFANSLVYILREFLATCIIAIIMCGVFYRL